MSFSDAGVYLEYHSYDVFGCSNHFVFYLNSALCYLAPTTFFLYNIRVCLLHTL